MQNSCVELHVKNYIDCIIREIHLLHERNKVLSSTTNGFKTKTRVNYLSLPFNVCHYGMLCRKGLDYYLWTWTGIYLAEFHTFTLSFSTFSAREQTSQVLKIDAWKHSSTILL